MNAAAVPVGPALVLIRHRLAGLADEISSTVSREGRAVQALAGVVEDLVIVVEQIEIERRAASSATVMLDGKVIGVASMRPDVSS